MALKQKKKEKPREKETIDAYLQAINDIKTYKIYYLKTKTGKGTKYKQPKHNAYKIQDGNYCYDRSSKTCQ